MKITALITLVGQGLQKSEREKAIEFSPSPATKDHPPQHKLSRFTAGAAPLENFTAKRKKMQVRHRISSAGRNAVLRAQPHCTSPPVTLAQQSCHPGVSLEL